MNSAVRRPPRCNAPVGDGAKRTRVIVVVIASKSGARARATRGRQQQMTTIDKLKIQGIRSFDPQNATLIDFYKPLTLIVGQNGAGKTVRAEACASVRWRARACVRLRWRVCACGARDSQIATCIFSLSLSLFLFLFRRHSTVARARARTGATADDH